MNKVYHRLKSGYFVDDLSVSYTLKTDDITHGAKPQGTPYLSRKGSFDENGVNAETESKLSVSEKSGGYLVGLKSSSDKLSEFGLNLPLKFMGKKNCGGWKKQYLFNSPYNSADNKHIFCYLTNPEGKNLLIVSLKKADGWKMDYSLFSGGQYFDNLKFLASFDNAYHGSGNTNLSLLLLPVNSYSEALQKVAAIKNIPVAFYDRSYVKLGNRLKINVVGDFDFIKIGNKKFYNEGGYAFVMPDKEGLLTAVPYKGRKKGADCTIFAYKSLGRLMKKSMYSVSESDLASGDGNLCEWQCHISEIYAEIRQKNGADKESKKRACDYYRTERGKGEGQANDFL